MRKEAAIITSVLSLITYTNLQGSEKVELPCPANENTISPKVTTSITQITKGETVYQYTYKFEIGESKSVLSNIRLKGLTDASVSSWDGIFDSCRALKNGSIVSCWIKKGASTSGQMTIDSHSSPGVVYYFAQSSSPKIISKNTYDNLLKMYGGNKQDLTESMYDSAMSQCSSTAYTFPEEKFVSGIIEGPSDNSAKIEIVQGAPDAPIESKKIGSMAGYVYEDSAGRPYNANGNVLRNGQDSVKTLYCGINGWIEKQDGVITKGYAREKPVACDEALQHYTLEIK